MEEGIRTGQEMSWDMDDFEVKISKVEQPLCLTMIEVLCLMEVCQVLVICKDLDGEREAMEIMSSGLQGTDNCKEFSVVDIVVSFCRNEQLREVGAGVPIPIGVGLEEDGTRGIL